MPVKAITADCKPASLYFRGCQLLKVLPVSVAQLFAVVEFGWFATP